MLTYADVIVRTCSVSNPPPFFNIYFILFGFGPRAIIMFLCTALAVYRMLPHAYYSVKLLVAADRPLHTTHPLLTTRYVLLQNDAHCTIAEKGRSDKSLRQVRTSQH